MRIICSSRYLKYLFSDNFYFFSSSKCIFQMTEFSITQLSLVYYFQQICNLCSLEILNSTPYIWELELESTGLGNFNQIEILAKIPLTANINFLIVRPPKAGTSDILERWQLFKSLKRKVGANRHQYLPT